MAPTLSAVHLFTFICFSVRIDLYLTSIDRGPYASAQVLLNLLNELGKSDKMRGLSSSFSQGVKFNNTRAQMLDYIYHMTLELLEISFLALEI